MTFGEAVIRLYVTESAWPRKENSALWILAVGRLISECPKRNEVRGAKTNNEANY